MLKMEGRPVGRLFGKLRQWCALQRRRMRARNNAVANNEDSWWRLHGAEYSSHHRGLRNATLRIRRENNDDNNNDDDVTTSAMERGLMVFGTFRLQSFGKLNQFQRRFKQSVSSEESKRASLYKNEKNEETFYMMYFISSSFKVLRDLWSR